MSSKIIAILLSGLLICNLFNEFDTSKIKLHAVLEGSRVSTTASTLLPHKINFNNYTLILTEEFNGNLLNNKVWDYYDENKIRGFGKMVKENISVSNGTLKICAKKNISKGSINFSGGMISTQRSLNQRYGYFEVRAKLNKQIGPHSAFWLLQHSVGKENTTPNPSVFGTEIDVFEYHCAAGPNNLYHALHWNGYNFSNGSHRVLLSQSVIPGISDGFHIFGFEWTPKEYIVYVDGEEKQRTTEAISHIPEFVLLSMEVSGNGGDRFKMLDNVADTFEVDYFKAYERKPSVTIYEKPDFYGWVSQPLLPGNYTTAKLTALGVNNNQASSIQVPKGWKVIAYDGDNFTGDSVVITADAREGGKFDNKLSSLKILNR